MQPGEQRDEVEMLWLMLLIRRFEERASQQYQAQKIGGFCHLYIGQEAVVTGAVAATMPAWPNFLAKIPVVPVDSVVRCIFSTRNITCTVDTPS